MEKILIYALTENIGGIEEYALNLSRYKTSGNSYGYVILGEKSPYIDEIRNLGSKYYFIPKRNNLLKNIITTRKLFKNLRNEYDYLYFNTSALGYIIPYLFAIRYKYKIILHSHLDQRKNASLIKKIVHYSNYKMIKDRIVKRFACSKEAAKWMFKKDYEAAIVIPNAIHIDKFQYNSKVRELIRKEIGATEKTIVIGNVGRLTKFKNQTFLIDIIKYFNESNENVKLVLVGDGEDEKKLKEKATRLKLEDKIVFWGRTRNPENVMNAMDCIVMPSLSEGFPISIIEAQASGLPCVVSDNITKEVNITNNVTYLPLDCDILEWCEKILKSVKFERYNKNAILKEKGYDVYNLEKYLSEVICYN